MRKYIVWRECLRLPEICDDSACEKDDRYRKI